MCNRGKPGVRVSLRKRKKTQKALCVCVWGGGGVRERRKIEPTVWGKKVPFALDGIRTCTSGIRAHQASDYTARVRPPRVSRNKHFSHSPVSSTAKQPCMKTLQLPSAGPRRKASARTLAESEEACQRKTKDRADGMREKSAFCPRRDSNLYLWDTRPPSFRLHYEGQAASRQSKQHFSHSPVSSTAKQSCMKTLQLLSAGPRRQASARTSAESEEAHQRKTKDRADGMREKSAFCPRRDSNLYLWDTRPPCFRLHYEGQAASRQSKQHFSHSPVSSTA